MAKTKPNTHTEPKININYENSTVIGNKEKIEAEVKKEVLAKENKKIKISFIHAVISDYGTFEPGQEAELEERIANKMINGGYAVKC